MYGITIDQYEEMLAAQEGCCSICKIHVSTLPGRFGVLHVDHNHETGKVRELLCHKCNVGIGMFKEDPKILAKVLDYLKKHE
tara:strand:- start:41 stop:286 length:246 start_codon:yes stop_codon:yes gene_type:complete